MPNHRFPRRDFLRAAAGALAAPYVVPRGVLGGPGRPGAGDRIRVGLIGSGYRSRDLTKESPPDLSLVAVADCDLRQIAGYLAAMKDVPDSVVSAGCAPYQDYREMLDKESLDGVFIATTTHARALVCLHAMQAGLDVYGEKPLTLTVEEGQYLVRAERKYGRVFQTGTQQRSVAINNFGSDLVKNGAIGKVHTVICPNFIGPELRPELPSQPTPPEMNWDMWCHQTDLIPYTPALHPGLGRWGRYREYDGGGLGWGVTGWGAHAFDQVQRALGTDDTTPEEIWLEETGPNAPVTMRYPNGTLLKLALPKGKGPGLGAIFVGEKGKIEINRNRLASNPPELVEGAPPPADKSEYASVAHGHIRNWVDCMRSRKKPVAHAEVGHRSSVICILVNTCRELGRRLKWDPVKEEFVGDDEANRLRCRPRRQGYELPETV
ncbi:MAG TPA: Gfo/Idh/MocA family oxidoreductase [Thermoguttaceae bacterium]|nr:Gfo/Idh/MocA family oxidoreductase [Thermoguttaceae bacterium]